MGKNRLIVKEVAEEKPEEDVKKPLKKKSKTEKVFQEFISGAIIKEYVLKNLLFIFYLVFFTLLYISNTYYALGTMRDIEKTKNQIKELRYEYVSTKKQVIETSRRNKVIEKLKVVNKNLKESKVPPYRVVSGE